MDCVSSMVTRDLVMEVVHPDDRVEQVPVLLRYETSDPYAVHADFLTGSDRRVRWCFSRELMSEGLEGATGHGDVRIWPVSRGGVKMINIALMSDDGAAVVQALKADVAEFLGSSYGVCPPGVESAFVDLDAGLRSLFEAEGA